MKFIVDECIGPKIANWLKNKKYEVISIFDDYRGLKDIEILQLARKKNAIIITNDKDFGELIYRDKHSHNGIILLRLENEIYSNKIKILDKVFTMNIVQIKNNFIVVTEKNIRVIKKRNNEK